nr:ABZJ_00895 family protein [Kordiimonas marina]
MRYLLLSWGIGLLLSLLLVVLHKNAFGTVDFVMLLAAPFVGYSFTQHQGRPLSPGEQQRLSYWAMFGGITTEVAAIGGLCALLAAAGKLSALLAQVPDTVLKANPVVLALVLALGAFVQYFVLWLLFGLGTQIHPVAYKGSDDT